MSRVLLGVDGDSRWFVGALRNNVRRVLALRSAIAASKPNAVISFLDNVNVLTLLATRLSNTPVVVTERTDPRQWYVSPAWRTLRALLYRKASALVVQTKSVLPWAISKVGEKRAFVIPNPITIPASVAGRLNIEVPKPFVLAVGSLAPWKGFDLLLNAFARVSEKFPEWSLVILGEGSERARLEALASQLGIEKRTQLPGLSSDPIAVMTHASIFVLSSRLEGFPNALLEAMACGLPAISFDCPSGPGEIIRHGVDGVLVAPEDVSALAEAIRELMAHPEKRNALAVRARDVVQRFSMDRVMTMWEELLRNI